MLILGKARAKDPTKGYATTFLPQLDAALDHLVANGIRVVVNAGGLNPAGLAAATRELAARRGHELRVAYVDGDDVFGRLGELQAAGHPLTHLTTGEPLTSWPHRAAHRQRLPRRVRHRPRPGRTAPTSSSPVASPMLRWSSVPPPGGGTGAPTTTTPSPAPCAPAMSSNAARRPPAATSPASAASPTSRSRASPSPRSPPTAPR